MKATLRVDFDRIDSTTMHGVLTRSGEFEYRDGIRTKDWNNLKEVFNETEYVPLIGSKMPDSHKDLEGRLLGFSWNWQPDDENEHMYGDVEFFDDIKNLSDLEDPKDLPVSFGFRDVAPMGSGTQEITKLHHLAVSLNANEKDRCSSRDGQPCTISVKATKKTASDKGRSSSSILGDLVKLKKKRDDSKMADPKDTKDDKNDTDDKITTDSVATPDNIGTESHKTGKINASAKASFMLDCQKYGTKSPENCEKAWAALNSVPYAPQKTDKKAVTESPTDLGKTKDMDDLKSEVESLKNQIGSFVEDMAKIIPTLSQVAQEKQQANAIKMVEMREDLVEAGYCKDMVEKITDFDELKLFYDRVRTNKSNFIEPDPNEIRSTNTSRLLGKKIKQDMQDWNDMMESAKKDAIASLHNATPVKEV
jgi:hypothetical protein